MQCGQNDHSISQQLQWGNGSLGFQANNQNTTSEIKGDENSITTMSKLAK